MGTKLEQTNGESKRPPPPWSDDEWRVIAECHLSRWEGDRASARDYVSAQSRWMVAQLFIANGGALTALTAAEALQASLPSAGPWFAAGVALSILCGLGTWAHAQMAVDTLGEIADPCLPFDRDRWPKVNEMRVRRESVLHGLAIAAGALSLLAFAVGACLVVV